MSWGGELGNHPQTNPKSHRSAVPWLSPFRAVGRNLWVTLTKGPLSQLQLCCDFWHRTEMEQRWQWHFTNRSEF